MAGVRDHVKAARVRRLLKFKKYQEYSDRLLAQEASVSRAVIRRVRTELIAAGLCPVPEYVAGISGYRPGVPQSARGGYLLTPDGRTVKELDWYQGEIRKVSQETARHLSELIQLIRQGKIGSGRTPDSGSTAGGPAPARDDRGTAPRTRRTVPTR